MYACNYVMNVNHRSWFSDTRALSHFCYCNLDNGKRYKFSFFSIPLWGINLLLGLVTCLSVLCVFVASGPNREWLNPLLVTQSLGEAH